MSIDYHAWRQNHDPIEHLYFDGSLSITVPREDYELSFAHVCDLHLAPPTEERELRFRQAIDWCEKLFDYPGQRLASLLDEIVMADVDFVIFGGDNIDYYHPEPARRILEMCRNRGLHAYFQLGNHDSESPESRYVTHEYIPEPRDMAGRVLCDLWEMPGTYYAFEAGSVHCIVVDTSHYVKNPDGYAAVLGKEQTEWLLGELGNKGPVIIFQHVPFMLPNLEHRLRAVWRGILACVAEDADCRRIRTVVENESNVLGVFTCHAHLRSEDRLGKTWQYMTGPAHDGHWRLVKLSAKPAPKSLRLPGEPFVG